MFHSQGDDNSFKIEHKTPAHLRSDSPIFGAVGAAAGAYGKNIQQISKHKSKKNSDAMLIDDNSPIKQPQEENKKMLFQPHAQISQIQQLHQPPSELLKCIPIPQNAKESEELKRVQKTIRKQEEQHKQQIIHVETVSMMTKYQLVFIKLETSLNRIGQAIKSREWEHKAWAFKVLEGHSSQQKLKASATAQLIYLQMEKRVQQLCDVLQRQRESRMRIGLRKIHFCAQLKKYELKVKQEQEKMKRELLQVLNEKDSELGTLSKKNEELNTNLHQTKGRETELTNKLKFKEKHLQALEQENFQRRKPNSPKSTSHNNNSQDFFASPASSTRLLEQRINQLESENNELRQRVLNDETNVTAFIKDMSDLLDQHDTATSFAPDDI